MYNEHFGLTQAPFRITPDTGLFYTGGGRGDVLDALVYAVTTGEGIVKVVGEVGTGKTMLCRMLAERLPDNVQIAYLANPSLTPADILHAVALELGLEVPPEAPRLQVMHRLQQALLERHAQNRRVVALVEEAQSMPVDTLEEIRLLSNLETKNEKLLQIILFGQPELDENLALPAIRQLRERITHSFQLKPLGGDEIKDYVAFRLRASGYRGRDAFTRDAYRAMSRASEGLTRRVNIIADKAMLAAYAEDTHDVAARHVKVAIQDSEFGSSRRPGEPRSPVVRLAAGAAGVAILAGTLGWYVGTRSGDGAGQESPVAMQDAGTGTPGSMMVAAAESTPGAMGSEPPANPPADEPVTPSTPPTPPPRSEPPAPPPPAAVSPAVTQVAETVPPKMHQGVSAVDGDAVKLLTTASEATGLPKGVTVTPEAMPASTAVTVSTALEASTAVTVSTALEASTAADTSVAQIADGGAPEERPAGPVNAEATTPAATTLSDAVADLAPSAPTTGGAATVTAAPPEMSGVLTAAAEAPPASPRSVVKDETDVATPAATETDVVTPVAMAAPRIPSTRAAPSRSPRGSLLDERLDHTQEWLSAVNPNHFSIQLLATDATQRSNLEAFLRRRARAGQLDQVFVYRTRISERVWFGVLFGDFSSFAEAQEALEGLPRELIRHQPFIRNIRDITALG